MKDARTWLDRLRTEAEECRLISRLATNPAKRETFARLAETHDRQADELGHEPINGIPFGRDA